MPKKTFEWYKVLTEIGRFEVELGRTKFFNTARLHLAILAGMLALGSYGVKTHEEIILFLSILVAIFGTINAIMWLSQIKSSSIWESRWDSSIANLEEHSDFRNLVGAESVKAWSHDEVKRKLPAKLKKSGASPRHYKTFVISLIVFYLVFSVGCSIFSKKMINEKEIQLNTSIKNCLN